MGTNSGSTLVNFTRNSSSVSVFVLSWAITETCDEKIIQNNAIMEKRVVDINLNNKKELIWFLYHDHIYTIGTSGSEKEIREKITYRVELVTLKHILRVFLNTFMKIHELHNIVHIVLNFSVGMCVGRRTRG